MDGRVPVPATPARCRCVNVVVRPCCPCYVLTILWVPGQMAKITPPRRKKEETGGDDEEEEADEEEVGGESEEEEEGEDCLLYTSPSPRDRG
eukprot:524713-Rhodomonas_salina.1